jgi:hypothetical protein
VLHVNLLWSAQEKSNSKSSVALVFMTVHAQSLQRLQALHTEEFKSVEADEPV